MADAKKIVGGLGKVTKALLADGEEEAVKAVTAAQRAEAGRKAAQLIKSQPQVKASEALGQQMEKGIKRVTTTQADRTRVGGGNIGGAPFSAISEVDPNYAGKVWGVMDEGTAARLKNLTDPETVWTTMLGSANQLKTNPVVFDKLKRQFIDSMKQGNLSPELEAKINHNLALTFGEGASIRDPKIWKEADTFEKRAALADLMMGQGIPPSKGGLALGGEKSGKGVIFRPTDTLKRETEPTLLHTEHGGDIPTFAAGPRLFKLEKESVNRPDLHPGFPTLLTGKDMNVNMIPTPTEIFLPDWHKAFKDKKPERFQGPWSPEIIGRRKSGSYELKGAEGPGYYDLALGLEGEGLPSQALNDEYIRHLLREGFKKGGSVDIDAADRRLAKAIEARMAQGGGVDIEAADARLADAIAKHMAGGGGAFKKLDFTEDDSPVQVGIHANKMGENENAGVMANLDMKGAGRLGVGSNLSGRNGEIHPSTMVNYSNNVGNLGVNANIIKPNDAPNDMMMTNLMASYPIGEGRVSAGMHGNRMDGTHRVTGHSLGYNTPLSGGNFNVNMMKPKEGKPMFGAQYSRSFADGGKLVRGIGKVGKRLMAEEQVASDAIGKAAQSAGMNAPVTANKPLTGIQDFHTSLMDSVRARAMDAQKQMDSWDYKYAPGQYVFTEHGAKNNLPPLKILEKSRHGWNIVREDPTNPLSKKVIDPATGKAQRTPYEPGYRVRRENGDDWSEFVIPESAIKGDVELARGGLTMADGGKLVKGATKIGKRLLLGETLPAAEREENLRKMLETSKIKERLYHATPEDIKFFKPGGLNPKVSGEAIWLSNDPTRTPAAHNIGSYANPRQGVNVMPVHVQAKNPMVLDDETMLKWAQEVYGEGSREFPMLMPKKWREEVMKDYDSIVLADPYKRGDSHEIIMFEPEKIKSAIGNRGTYNTDTADITKAHGGVAHMDKGGKAGKVVSGLASVGQRLLADAPIESQAAKQMRINMMPTARIGLEAPGILIPSKMNNVREAVRNMKGNYGARRVERAADEIPNLEKMYQEDALKEAFTGDNASAMMTLNPAEFERYAAELTKRNSVGPKMAELAKQGDIDKLTVPTDEYIQHLQRLRDGFSDVPYLNLFKDEIGIPTKPSVTGHEGRHRNRALAESGAPASLVKINPRGDLREGMPRRTQEDFIEALKEELELSNRLVVPESEPYFRRPNVELPDVYAEGGGAFKKLEFNQHFDGGGMAVDLSEPSEGSRREPLLTKKDWENVKRNAPAVYDWAKQNVKDEASQLQSARGVKDFALRTGAQYLGGIPDLANLGLMGIDALADTKLSSEKPWFGSEQYIDAMHKAGMLGENEFPIAETVAGVLAPAGLIRKGIKKVRGVRSEPKKRLGGLTAMSR